MRYPLLPSLSLFVALAASAQSGGNQLTVERISTTPGIKETVMAEFVLSVLGPLDHCVPDLLPETGDVDDRITVRFVVEEGGQLKVARRSRDLELKVQGILDQGCVVEQAAHWKIPKPNG